MNFGEFVILLVLLTVLFFIPIIVIQFFGRNGSIFKRSLQECPSCGAENDNAKIRCYCCGHDFESSPLEGLDAALLQRVRQADDSKKRRRATSETSATLAEKPLPSEQTKFRAD
jgi:hypothetical protein